MSDAIIAKIGAKVNGGEYSAEGLSVRLSVNNVATVRVDVAAGAEDEVTVLAPVSADVIERIGNLQKARLAGRVEPDLTITADDGLGGQMTFNGFLSAPVLDFSSGRTIDQVTGVGVDSLLESLHLGIYDGGYKHAREEAGLDPELAEIPAADTGDIIGIIKQVTEALVSNYQATVDAVTGEGKLEVLKLRHELNEAKALELWYTLLGNSTLEFKSIKEAADLFADSLPLLIWSTLQSRTPGFWNVIRQLMSLFHMHYIPSLEGTGRFERVDTTVAEPEGSIQVGVIGVNVSDGSSYVTQPGGVIMSSAARDAYRTDTQLSGQEEIVAYYPKPLVSGFIHEEVPPMWIVRAVGDRASVKDDTPDTRVFDLELFLTKFEEYKKEEQASNDAATKVLEELCEVIFKDIQLANSVASLTLPLDFSQNKNIGKRVRVEIQGPPGEEGGSFTAFVSSIAHDMRLRGGKQLLAVTTISCTHVKYD